MGEGPPPTRPKVPTPPGYVRQGEVSGVCHEPRRHHRAGRLRASNRLTDIRTLHGFDETTVLTLVAEKDSEHPLAKAIVAAAAERRLALPPTAGFSSVTGKGVRAAVDGREVLVGTTRLLSDVGIDADAAAEVASRFAEQGKDTHPGSDRRAPRRPGRRGHHRARLRGRTCSAAAAEPVHGHDHRRQRAYGRRDRRGAPGAGVRDPPRNVRQVETGPGGPLANTPDL